MVGGAGHAGVGWVGHVGVEYFEDLALHPEAPIPIKEWKRYADVFSIILKGKREVMLHRSTHKIHCRAVMGTVYHNYHHSVLT